MSKLLFQNDSPRILNYKSPDNTSTRPRVSIMRPSKFSNPFKIGSVLTIREVRSIIANQIGLPGETECLKVALRYALRGGSLTRSEVLECFEEYWTVIRLTGVVTDAEMLALRNHDLVCCCKPKGCHGDILLKDYKRTVQKRSKPFSLTTGIS